MPAVAFLPLPDSFLPTPPLLSPSLPSPPLPSPPLPSPPLPNSPLPNSLPHPPPHPVDAVHGVDLLALTRRVGAEVLAGRHGPLHFGDPDRPGDPEARWHVRLPAPDDVDVWLITWLPSQSTRLHDHGGSAGAFTVVRGRLTEAVWDRGPAGGGLRDVARPTGGGVAFDSAHVHDVRNLDAEPAVSVHAYRPPLRRMGYYDVHAGSLQLTTVRATTDPEQAA